MRDYIFNRFEMEIKRAHYSFKRYNKITTFVLLYHENDLEIETLSSHLRASDKLLKIDSHTYFIKFAFTAQEETFKASQNLLLALDQHFNKRNCYIAIEALDIANTPKMVVNKLLQILEETKKHAYSRIGDESILNSTF